MSELQSKRTETEDTSRVDHLLGLLGDLSQHDPSPALRERLSALAVQRLNENSGSGMRIRSTDRTPKVWLKPIFAAALFVVIVLATIYATHVGRQEPAQANRTVKESHPVASLGNKGYVAPAARPAVSRRPRTHHSPSTVVPPIGARQMTMRLPYSNSAIETGTNTTIQVSMSQSELLSLGFPITATVQDARIVAELTLGDDGLPRAISVPLPLVVTKEKK